MKHITSKPSKRMMRFSCIYCQKNFMKLNQIKEAHIIQAHSRQEGMMFFYANTNKKKLIW